MNRYPIWKYIAMLISLVLGLLYTLPNFYGEAPAVQVSSGKATVKVEAAMMGRVEATLKRASIEPTGLFFDGNSVKVRLRDNDTQLKAKDALVADLNPDAADPSYIVALNLLSSSPDWLTALRALPMYLGLDLRGGVHFLLQVDMKQALSKRLDATVGDLRTQLREKNLRHAGISRSGDTIEIRFRDAAAQTRIEPALFIDARHRQTTIIVSRIQQTRCGQRKNLAVHRTIQGARTALLKIRASATADQQAVSGECHRFVIQHKSHATVGMAWRFARLEITRPEWHALAMRQRDIRARCAAECRQRDAAAQPLLEQPRARDMISMHVRLQRIQQLQPQLGN
jgi:hypothetical protein